MVVLVDLGRSVKFTGYRRRASTILALKADDGWPDQASIVLQNEVGQVRPFNNPLGAKRKEGEMPRKHDNAKKPNCTRLERKVPHAPSPAVTPKFL